MVSIRLSGQEQKEKLRLSHYLFLLFWLMKPLYLSRASGSMQLSDMIFFGSFVVWLYESGWKINISKNNRYLLAFIICVFVINSICVLIFKNTEFLTTNLYYLYNFFIVLEFGALMFNKRFLKMLLNVTFFNVALQLLIFLSGGGRSMNDVRYMGTFNDPNQFSFFTLSAFMIIYMLLYYFHGSKVHKGLFQTGIVFTVVNFLMFKSGSTGMLLGILSFFLVMVFGFAKTRRSPLMTVVKAAAIALLIGLIAYVIGSGVLGGIDRRFDPDKDFLLYRLNEKINMTIVGGLMYFLEERCMDRVLFYPIYLIFGAGEGFYQRFDPIYHHEIHSTLLAIWFSYGLIPFTLLLKWLRETLRNINTMLWPVYLGLLLESSILANQRQPALWMILVLAGLQYQKGQDEKPLSVTVQL